MKKKLGIISLIAIIAVAYTLSSKKEVITESFEQIQINKKTETIAQTKDGQTEIKETTQIKKDEEKKANIVTNSSGLLEGKIIAKLAADKAGFTAEEGGGIGITGVIFNQRGEAIVVDRMNGEVSLVVDEHTTRNLLKLEDDQFLKGVGLGENGDEYLALVGDSELDLIRFNSQGEKTKVSLGIKPDHLNGMRIESLNDSVFIYGVEKTYEVGPDGKVSEFYGTPLTSNGERRNIDVELAESGFVELTVRNKEGAPIETKVLSEAHGSVQGVYRINSNEVALVLESNPFSSDYNAQNPHYTVMKVNSDGEISSEVKIPRLSDLSIDQPIEIRDGKIIQSYQSEKEGLSIHQYDLP